MALLAFIRALHFASLMSLWGGGFYLWLLGQKTRLTIPEGKLRLVAILAASLALLTGAIWLLLVTGQMMGNFSEAIDLKAIMVVLRETRFGEIWLGRLLGLLLLWLLALFAVRSSVLALVAGLVLASLGLVSHAAAATGGLGPGNSFNDAIHLLTSGFWVGGLIVLTELCRLYRHDSGLLVTPFALFSSWGVYAVLLLVLSGTLNTLLILPVAAMKPSNAYADILAVKITLTLGMIMLALANRFLLLPALAKRKVVWRLERNVVVELVLGFLIVAIVGYLGMLMPS